MKYHDCEGNEISLFKLVRTEPGWAANRIDFMNKQVPQLEAKITELESQLAEGEALIIELVTALKDQHKPTN